MDTANYLQNWLPIKYAVDKVIIISEEAWTETRQNLQHIQIFGNTINTYIFTKKYSKSDIYKTWNRIIIGYTDTTKHLGVWALKSYQVLIASKSIINKDKCSVKLLIENSIPPSPKPL